MNLEETVLEVYQAGPLTVVGFGGRTIIHDINIAPVHDQLIALIDEHRCTQLAFDLTGVRFVPSGLLGIFASLRRRNVEVHVYNPSNDVRDVLETTNLTKLVHVHEVAV